MALQASQDVQKITRDQKITLTLPKSLLARLDANVPTRRRGKFIVEAIEERLAIEEQLAALICAPVKTSTTGGGICGLRENIAGLRAVSPDDE